VTISHESKGRAPIVQTRMSPTMIAGLDEVAKREGMSRSQAVRLGVDLLLDPAQLAGHVALQLLDLAEGDA
jgi:hypothetical protein